MIADESVKVLGVPFHESDSVMGRFIAEPLCRSQYPFVDYRPLLTGVRLAWQRIKALVGHCSILFFGAGSGFACNALGPRLE